MPFKKGNISWNKGLKCPQISKACKGRVAWNKGIPMPEERRLKMIARLKGRHFSPKTEFKKGQNIGNKHPHWKGGRTISDGYILIFKPEHPYATKQGYVREHKLIMEKQLGRYLTRKEQIHHINGNKKDNRIENLILFENAISHRNYHLLEHFENKLKRMKSKIHILYQPKV